MIRILFLVRYVPKYYEKKKTNANVKKSDFNKSLLKLSHIYNTQNLSF